MKPIMTAQEVENLIHLGFETPHKILSIEEVGCGSVRTRLLFRENMLRPGKIVSGPALFTAADLAMYALVLSHSGPALMAVTSNLNINFLAKAEPGDVISVGKILKLGQRLAVMEASMYSSANPNVLVAHATGSYALPLNQGKT